MDHAEAITLKAAERYVLGDLSVSEVEEFERHFFDCSPCSEELRMLAILQDNARAAFLEQRPAPSSARPPMTEPQSSRGGWRAAFGWGLGWQWAGAFAGIVIALLGGFEFGLRRQAEAPQSISAFPLYAASRGDETVISPPAGAQFYSLYLDRTWDRDYPSYRAVIRDASGAERYSVSVAAPAPGHAIYLLAPARALPAGKYTLAILGMDSAGQPADLARFPFTLRVE
jgi:hypothetical protein